MSALQGLELERLSELLASGSLVNAQEIAELLSVELGGPPLSPDGETCDEPRAPIATGA
jgi:hypothetical protein